MRYIAVFNKSGGTFRTMDLVPFCAQAEDIFARNGHQLECRVVDSEDVVATLAAANGDPLVDAILVGGGDGTISAAAELSFRSGVPLAVLPAGTMNLFARAMQIPLDLGAALEAIAAGYIDEVDIATANERTFVHQFSVGVHPRLVQLREQMSYRSRLGKLFATVRAVGSAILRPPRFEVEISTNRGVERRAASGLVVSNNPIGEGHMPHADRLDQGVLGLYIGAPMSTWELAKLSIAVAIGRWRSSPQVLEREVRSAVLVFPGRKHTHKAVIDGELIDLARRVEITVHPGGLKVVHPAALNPITIEEPVEAPSLLQPVAPALAGAIAS